MVLLPGIGAVARAVQVQDHVVLAGPVRHALDRGVADHQVDHDDHAAQALREVGAGVHLLHRAGGHVEVVALDLAGRGARLVDRVHAVEEAVAPVHEGLRVDVLVVLHEVEAALQAFVDHTAVVAAREPELRLGGSAEQRPAELVEPLALDDHARGRAGEGLQVGDRDAHVLEPQRLDRLEAEDVADDRRREVGDRAAFEKVDVVGDVGEELGVGPGAGAGVGDGVDPVGLGAVEIARGQAVGPDDRPRRGRGFTGHCRRGLFLVDALLRRDPEHRDHVGVLRLVVGLPVAHLLVLEDTGAVALLAVEDLLRFVHVAQGRLRLAGCRSRM